MRHIVKLQRHQGLIRINLPKLLCDELDYEKVDYIILEPVGRTQIMIRRFIDGETGKGKSKRHQP